MVFEVVIPVLDQTGDEVVLQLWLAEEGDTVEPGDVLCEVETAKTTVEIQAEAGGLLRRRLVEAGQAIPPRTVIGLIGPADEALPEIDPFRHVKQDLPPAPTTRDSAPTGETRTPPVASSPPIAPAQAGATQPPSRAPRRVIASPRAKRLAAELGVDLSHLQGTGPEGSIVEDDIRKAVARPATPAADRAAQAKAALVSRSWQTIPHFYTAMSVELSRIVDRKRRDGDTTYTDYFAHAIAGALQAIPAANGFWTDDGLQLVSEVRLGLVIQTARGLVIPVLRDLGRRSLAEIAAERKRLVEQAHAGRLPSADLEGATFTLSNVGAGHVDYFTAIISPPQVAILSVGSIQPRPVVVGSELAIRPAATFTLGADHRAIDGRLSSALLEELKRILEAY